jgi:methylase of polypeptide subunit release factors
MLGVESFDIVIGNPPYISHDKVTIPKEELRKYKVFEGFADLYCYFIEMAVRASNRAHGTVCFIVSNSFIKSQYGEPLRRYLTSNKLLDKLVNVEESQLFQLEHRLS